MASVIALVLALFLAPDAWADQLVIVTEEYPPHEYREEGRWVGTDVDIIAEVCKRIGCEPVYREYPWKRCLEMMRQGKADAIISLFNTKERAEFLHYPATNLSFERNVVYARKGSGLEVNRISDMDGMRVGVIADYAYSPDFDRYTGMKVKDISKDPETLLKKLDKGRFQVGLLAEATFRVIQRKPGLQGHFEPLHVLTTEPMYIGFSKKATGSKRMAEAFDAALKQLVEDGTVEAIMGKY